MSQAWAVRTNMEAGTWLLFTEFGQILGSRNRQWILSAERHDSAKEIGSRTWIGREKAGAISNRGSEDL